MIERLDPVSCAFFNAYFSQGNSLNVCLSLKLGCHLREDLLTQAVDLVMQTFPTLRSNILIDLESKYRYFWQTVVGHRQVPIEFNTLTCADDDLEHQLIQLEDTQVNRPIALDQDYPFRILCTYWQDTFTHFLLVMGHVVGDAYTLCLITDKCFEYYQALSTGSKPRVKPLPYPMGDWEKLFNVFVTPEERERSEGIIMSHYQDQSRRDDENEWKLIIARMVRLQRNFDVAADEENSSLIPRPIPMESVNYESYCSRSLVHVFSSDQLSGLRRFAKQYNYNYSYYDALQLAYLYSQIELSTKPFDRIHMKVAINYRDLAYAQNLTSMPGTYATGSNFIIASKYFDDIGEILNKIWLERSEATHKLRNKSFLKLILMRLLIFQAVRSRDWETFLYISNPFNYAFENRLLLITNNFGVLDRQLSSVKRYQVQSIHIRGLPGTFGIEFYVFNRRLYVNCTHNPELTDPKDRIEAWHRLIRCIEVIAANG